MPGQAQEADKDTIGWQRPRTEIRHRGRKERGRHAAGFNPPPVIPIKPYALRAVPLPSTARLSHFLVPFPPAPTSSPVTLGTPEVRLARAAGPAPVCPLITRNHP